MNQGYNPESQRKQGKINMQTYSPEVHETVPLIQRDYAVRRVEKNPSPHFYPKKGKIT